MIPIYDSGETKHWCSISMIWGKGSLVISKGYLRITIIY